MNRYSYCKSRVWQGVLFILLMFGIFISSCGEESDSNEVDLSGVWSGFWLSEGAGTGGVVVILTQTNNYLSGEMQIEGNICSPDTIVSGTYNPETETVGFDLTDPNNAEHLVRVNGSYQPETDEMSVTFFVENWEICTGAGGSMEFNRY